jgi:hypothetical protein
MKRRQEGLLHFQHRAAKAQPVRGKRCTTPQEVCAVWFPDARVAAVAATAAVAPVPAAAAPVPAVPAAATTAAAAAAATATESDGEL